MLGFALAIILLLLSFAPSLAQDDRGVPKPDPDAVTPPALSGSITPRPDQTAPRTYADLDQQIAEQPVTLIVELQTPSVADVAADLSGAQAETAARLQTAQVEAAQRAVMNSLTAVGVDYRVVATTKRVLNGLIVEAKLSDMATISAVDGVANVYPAGIGELSLDNSAIFLSDYVPWAQGYTGKNVRIGIIDTGIDYQHADFGGSGPGTTFPTAKVAGGYDFVGDAWDPVTSPALVPDDDPMDEQGHGTEVAGIAAGYGVDSSGATFTGPWDGRIPFSSMRIAPGMAPEATLYALKIGSPSGYVSEAAAILALEWATDPNDDGRPSDHLDVVNLSVGRRYDDPQQGWSRAANNASKLGVIVVGAAGNYDDSYFIQVGPATGDGVISVAASFNGYRALLVNGSYFPMTLAGFGPAPLSPGVTAAVVLVNDGVSGPVDGTHPVAGTANDGCETPFVNAGAVNGAIALVENGYCDPSQKAANAESAGAVGVIVMDNTANPLSTIGFDTTDPADPGWTINIPAVFITQSTGNTIRTSLLGTPATLSTEYVTGQNTDILASFSARGPQLQANMGNIGLKPDITAPGVDIFSADAGTGNQGTNGSGTSSAAPHVAGVMALLRQRYPTWTVSQLKALVMNTATHNLYRNTNQTLPYVDPARAGAGRLDEVQAFNSKVIAYDTLRPDRVSVSFGLLNVVNATTWQRTITVENRGSSTVSYTASYVPMVHVDNGNASGIGAGGPGVTVNISPASVTVAPGGRALITVSLFVDPAQMTRPYTHAPTVSEIGPNTYRYWLAEESGYVQLTPTVPGSTSPLRVPVYAAPRPAGTVQAASTTIPTTGTTGTVNIPLAGTDVYTGTQVPYDTTSLVSAFQLQYSSPNEASSTGIYNAGDLRYVGIATNYPTVSNLASARLFFGIATYGTWASLSEQVTFQVYFDTNQDGTADYLLWNSSVAAYVGSPTPTDEVYSFLDNLSTPINEFRPERFINYYAPIGSLRWPDTRIFANDVMFMAVTIGHIPDLTLADGVFDYWVMTRYKDSVLADTVVDVSNVFTYDVTAQGVDTAAGAASGWSATLYNDWDGGAVPVQYDWSRYMGPNPPCVLLLHHHDTLGMRAETVCLQPDVVSDLAITKQVDDSTPNPGDTITYLITVVNRAATSAPVVIVQDLLPAGVTYVSHTASQGNYSPYSGQWTVGTLGPGESATLEIEATVDRNARGTITNTATVRPNVGTDRAPGNNIASAQIQVGGTRGGAGSGEQSGFVPVISKEAALAPGALGLPGDQIIWTITAANEGNAPGYDFQVVDTVRPELRIDRAEVERGTVSIEQRTVTWTIDRLDPGQSVRMQVYTTILEVPPDNLFSNEAVGFSPEGTVAATAQIPGVSTLPSTGYPPHKESHSDRTLAAVVLGLVAALGGFMLAAVRRKAAREIR